MLKPEDSFEPQLVINEIALPPGGEWSPQLSGWLVIHVNSGAGYWLHPRRNCELQPGTVLLFSDQIHGCLRASQVGELQLQFFRTEPAKLAGLVTMADQKLLQAAAGDHQLSLRVLPPNAQFTDRFKQLGSAEAGNTFPGRVQLLQLFLEVFDVNFHQPPAVATGIVDARERLKQMLDQTPVAELIELGFAGLASKTRCSPRHVSRLFTDLVGVSFREKQTELRLARACELLATTESKVVDVAIESGFQSTSLFGVMFKQRFGVGPAKWREQAKAHRAAKPAARRFRAAA
jgi:AraC-like DNA-binding protein